MTGDSFAPLSLMQNVLLSTDGTVTDLVSLFSGEDIHITKLGQDVVQDTGPAELQLSEAKSLLKREILLSGTTRHYLYARSYFILERMPTVMRRQLLETDTPIGLLWKEARLEMFREVVERKLEHNPELLQYFPGAADSRFLSRTYVVYHRQQPLGVITEKFPYSYFSEVLPLR